MSRIGDQVQTWTHSGVNDGEHTFRTLKKLVLDQSDEIGLHHIFGFSPATSCNPDS